MTVEELVVERDELKRQLKGKSAEIAKLKQMLLRLGETCKGIAMTKRLRREIQTCLHPDPAISKERVVGSSVWKRRSRTPTSAPLSALRRVDLPAFV